MDKFYHHPETTDHSELNSDDATGAENRDEPLRRKRGDVLTRPNPKETNSLL